MKWAEPISEPVRHSTAFADQGNGPPTHIIVFENQPFLTTPQLAGTTQSILEFFKVGQPARTGKHSEDTQRPTTESLSRQLEPECSLGQPAAVLVGPGRGVTEQLAFVEQGFHGFIHLGAQVLLR
jgi:hypothetical protein